MMIYYVLTKLNFLFIGTLDKYKTKPVDTEPHTDGKPYPVSRTNKYLFKN